MRKSSQSDVYKRLTQALREARASGGLTQAEVAKKLGKPHSFVAKYEQGERRIDVAEFLEISRALGTDARKLLRRIMG